MKHIYLIIAITLLIVPCFVLAAGIEVTPSKLKVELGASGGQYQFQIKNPSRQVQVFEVYPDDFTDIISVSPESFTLEAGASRSIVLDIKPKGEARALQTNLSVVAKNLVGQNFPAQAGLKIPLNISFAGAPEIISTIDLNTAIYLGVGLVIIGLAIGWFLNQKFHKPS
ncbi:MAG: hypothetical protein AAB657_03210 [Patescibacteria group bacterium]